jgi:hypothetical protein
MQRPNGRASLLEQSLLFAERTARRAWHEVKPLGPLIREPRIAGFRYSGHLGGEPGPKVTMLYVGEAQRAQDFHVFLGADKTREVTPPKEVFRGRVMSYMMQRSRVDEMARTADLVVRETFPLELGPAEGIAYHPFLDAYLDVARDLTQQIRRVRSKTYRRLLRESLRRSDCQLEVREGPEALAEFWHELHVPYVRSRFGKQSTVDSYEKISEAYQGCGRILVVRESGNAVAACVVLHDFDGPRILTYHRNGIKDSDSISPRALSERTAMLELWLMRYALEQGFKRINLGFTPAIANDGRFGHKSRLGCTFEPLAGGALLTIDCKESLRPALFARFALITGAPGAFTLHLGYDGASAMLRTQQWRGLLKAYMAPGIKDIHLHVSKGARAAGFVDYEKALREVAGEKEVVVEEV